MTHAVYVVHEAIDSVFGSYLLEWLSDRVRLSQRFPSLYFAVNTKSGAIERIFSKELLGYQTIGSLYSQCKNSESWSRCQKAANLKNVFYGNTLIKDPLSLFYDITLLLGIGDLNPGNVCSNFNQSSETTSINVGLVDIDAILKKHADSETFKRVRNYCEEFAFIDVDQCTRNLLNFYGCNPIALKTQHQDPNEVYFLETGDSALRGDRNKPRNKSIYSRSLCGDKIESCEIDPYYRRRHIATPPIDASMIKNHASKIIGNIQLSELLEIANNFMDGLEASYQRDPKLFQKILQQTEPTTEVPLFKILRSNAITLLTARYKMLSCLSESQGKTFFDLEQECTHEVESNLPLDKMNPEERTQTIQMALTFMHLDRPQKKQSFWNSLWSLVRWFWPTRNDKEDL